MCMGGVHVSGGGVCWVYVCMCSVKSCKQDVSVRVGERPYALECTDLIFFRKMKDISPLTVANH
jgi:hypothetical protein